MSENEQQAKPFITSVRIERKGMHEHVTIWIRSQLVGELVMGPGDAERFGAVLGSRDGREWLSESDVDQLVQERSERTRRCQATVADVIHDPLPKQGERSPELDARLEAWADQHLPLTPGAIAEFAAGNELTRRGLDLAAMNRERARADMPVLTAVQTLERIDAAAGALNDLRGMGFPDRYIPEPDRRPLPHLAARAKLGDALEPENTWRWRMLDERRNEIGAAMARARDLGELPKREWLDELNRLDQADEQNARQMVLTTRLKEAGKLLKRAYGGALPMPLANEIREWIKGETEEEAL